MGVADMRIVVPLSVLRVTLFLPNVHISSEGVAGFGAGTGFITADGVTTRYRHARC